MQVLNDLREIGSIEFCAAKRAACVFALHAEHPAGGPFAPIASDTQFASATGALGLATHPIRFVG
jgi:hypothetical protein